MSGAVALLIAGCAQQRNYEPISLEAGPVGTLKLQELWIQIANSKAVAADNEKMESLQLRTSPRPACSFMSTSKP